MGREDGEGMDDGGEEGMRESSLVQCGTRGDHRTMRRDEQDVGGIMDWE